ncbi:hypothetical protein AB0H07_38980 [Streptomyces sp. NPDC021354]|uniref:hypothetical protein n=1 Tax=Streptomyces sp. NPDC021354 TaxID=3154793 RepID=UPI0033FF6367
MEIAVAAAVGSACLAGVRLLRVWIGSRDRVRLAQLRQQGISERVRALPPGSTLTERHHGHDVRVRMGAPRGGARG